MIRFATTILPLLLAAAVSALAADTAAPASPKAPIVNFSLPKFTDPDGYRDFLVRGSEAWMTASNIIDVKELSVTVFSGDASNRIDTMMLSPAARLLPDEQIISGDSTLRVIDLQKGFEATGSDWRYTHKDKTIILHKKVRMVFRRELKDLLK